MKKKNLLIDHYPELMNEFDFDKNKNLNFNMLTFGSHKKAIWKCDKGHEWETTIKSRVNGNNCPYCSGRKIGYGNDLKSNFSEIALEWDYVKNGSLKPEQVHKNSYKKVSWKCSKGHEWETWIYARTKKDGYGCPYCSKKRVSAEYNLLVIRPDIAAEWDYEKNGELLPEHVMPSSYNEIWWKCSKAGHSWQKTASGRSQGNNCPYCRGYKVGYGNDLETINPYLAKEWHPSKNGSLKPNSVTIYSGKKVWWQCLLHKHEWEAQICNRSLGRNCPRCLSRTSFPEQIIHFYTKKYFPDTINSAKIKINSKNIEVDVYIPSLKFGIEYDGVYYHKKKEKMDKQKNETLKKEKNIDVLRFRESGLSNKLFSKEEFKVIKNEKDIEKHLQKVLKQLGILNPDIDVNRDRIKIAELHVFIKQEGSLLEKNPELSKQWHPTKNKNLTPNMFKPSSQQKAWWLCSKGTHVWKAEIGARHHGTGCPYCVGKKVGYGNDFETNFPELVKLWDKKLNGDLLPSQVTFGSGKKVHWVCFNCSYKWQTHPAKQNGRKKCQNCKIPFQ